MKASKIKIYFLAAFFAGLGFSSNAFGQDETKDSLSYYIKVAIANNPGVKSKNSAYEAFLERIQQAGAIPDPEISLEAYTMPMEVIGGRSLGNISFMQTFPWFGARKAARVEAGHNANIQKYQFNETVNDLILQITVKWYNMQKLNEQLRNNEENKKLLDQLEQLAVRIFSAPSKGSESGMSEVLRIRLEIAEIENNMESIHSQIKAETAAFNALLNRETTDEVILGNRLHKTGFLFSDTEAISAIEAHNPTLRMITEEGLAFKAKAEADKKLSYPMIGVGAQYMVIGKTSNKLMGMEGMNGKDMIMPMVSVSLPIFRNKYNAQQRESELWRKSSEENFKNTLNTLKSEYYSFKSRLDDADRKIRLYDKQKTLAETTYNLIVKEFVTGKSNLTNIIQVQRQLLDYQLKKAEAVADYNTMIASIQKLLATNR